MTLSRSAIYPLAYALLVLAGAFAAGLAGLWQSIDFQIYRQVYMTDTPQPNGRLHLVDVEYPASARQGRMQEFRAKQAAALRALAALDPPPRTVLLDIWISDQPEGVDDLAAAVAALHQRGARVLAAVEPKDRQGRLTGDFMQQHFAPFYIQVVDGFGHTQLDATGDVLHFQCRLHLPGAQGETRLTALPVLAGANPDCRDDGAIIIPLGKDSAFEPLTHRLAPGGLGFVPAFKPGQMPETVIVASLQEDSDNLLKRPGPVLLAWAVTDLARAGPGAARRPLNHPLAALGLGALTVLATLVAYRLAFRVLRVRVTPARWTLLAGALAPFALAAAAALLLASAGLVALDGGPVVPLAMPLALGLFAAGWAAFRARRWIEDERLHTELAAAGEERAIAYDVFISYAHEPPEHKAWVQAQVLGPLAALRGPNGKPLRIFFDASEIKVGRRWKAEIELALLGTRCFIAVYSERYFERPYCREEIEMADQLRIEGRLLMFPVARNLNAIPERYLRKLQYIDAQGDKPFADELCRQVANLMMPPATAQTSAQPGSERPGLEGNA